MIQHPVRSLWDRFLLFVVGACLLSLGILFSKKVILGESFHASASSAREPGRKRIVKIVDDELTLSSLDSGRVVAFDSTGPFTFDESTVLPDAAPLPGDSLGESPGGTLTGAGQDSSLAQRFLDDPTDPTLLSDPSSARSTERRSGATTDQRLPQQTGNSSSPGVGLTATKQGQSSWGKPSPAEATLRAALDAVGVLGSPPESLERASAPPYEGAAEAAEFFPDSAPLEEQSPLEASDSPSSEAQSQPPTSTARQASGDGPAEPSHDKKPPRDSTGSKSANGKYDEPPSVMGDVCIQRLLRISPVQAAGLIAKKTAAQEAAYVHLRRGRNDTNEADHQVTAREASEAAKIAGEYTTASSAVFAANIPKDPIGMSMCATRRGIQGGIETMNSARNRMVADKAAAGPSNYAGLSAADTPVIHVEGY